MEKFRCGGAEPTGPFRRIFKSPAAQALLLQIVSLAGVLVLDAAIQVFLGVKIGPFAAALLQGGAAALLTWYRGLASWWLAIQLIFPVALILALPLQLPPWLFLFAFLFLLFLYWTTFRTQVPFYPSGRAVWDQVADLMPRDRDIAVVDIGSGLGGLTLHLARRFPCSRVTGVEIAPLPWLVSVLRARWSGSKAGFSRQDYNRLDFADYDIVFAYLSPAAMPDLWRKASGEMRKGSLLISYEFPIPDVVPSTVLSFKAGDAQLHIFRM